MLGWTVAGAMFGLTGVVVAVITYLKSRGIRRAAFSTFTHALVGDVGLSDLEIRYKERKVPRVSSVTVLFWNAGTTTIRKDDIAPGDPLRIEVSNETEILGARVLARTREANRCEITLQPESPTTIPLTFDFLDPNDGVTVVIIHTGDANEETTTVKGTVMNAANGGDPERVWHATPSDQTKRARIAASIIGLVTAVIAAGVLTLFLFVVPIPAVPTIPLGAALVGIATTYGVISLPPKGEGRRRYLVPSELLPGRTTDM